MLQVMSPAFLGLYNRDVINIHHGLLPSFKGANPYRQVRVVHIHAGSSPDTQAPCTECVSTAASGSDCIARRACTSTQIEHVEAGATQLSC
jgi:hypothetical protein